MEHEFENAREILIQHARQPTHFGKGENAHGIGYCQNPTCGDKIKVSIYIKENKINNIQILPSGCNISIASASLMAEAIEGLEISEAQNMLRLVKENFDPSSQEKQFANWPLELTKLFPLKKIRENPLKKICVLMPWTAFENALSNFFSQP